VAIASSGGQALVIPAAEEKASKASLTTLESSGATMRKVMRRSCLYGPFLLDFQDIHHTSIGPGSMTSVNVQVGRCPSLFPSGHSRPSKFTVDINVDLFTQSSQKR
jgi:hypothetical protein